MNNRCLSCRFGGLLGQGKRLDAVGGSTAGNGEEWRIFQGEFMVMAEIEVLPVMVTMEEKAGKLTVFGDSKRKNTRVFR